MTATTSMKRTDDAAEPSGNRAPDRESLVAQIETIFDAIPEVGRHIRTHAPGEIILGEGERTGKIGFILEGTAALVKSTEDGETVHVDTVGRGEVIGLLSYFAREINLVSVYADTAARVFIQSWNEFDALQKAHGELAEPLGHLMRDTLMGRYRRLVKIHLHVARLNQELAAERAELRETIDELSETRSRLINQEKLAMLGKIVAGLAHELNNPIAAIARNTDYLAEAMQRLAGVAASDPRMEFWRSGESARILDTRAQRTRAEELKTRFPHLSRGILRRLAAVPPDLVDSPGNPPNDDAAWDEWLLLFESGRFLHTMRSASSRISRLVRSLKNYARPGDEAFEDVDIAAGLRDTLLILAHHFKNVEVNADIGDLPTIHGNPGELNQVWTNLLVNASEAMDGEGSLTLRAIPEGGKVRVILEDSGPGLPKEKIDAIFEPHYTTKAQGGQFGLGLGLSIAREIVHKHSGTIHAENRSGGGARFTITLPVEAEGTSANP